MIKPIRRVVIAHNEQNKSCVIKDCIADKIDHFMPGVDDAVSINLWATDKSPASLRPDEPQISYLKPKKNGTIFRICDLPPESTYITKLDEIGFNFEKIPESSKQLKHPLMHQWQVLSYVIVLEGEVKLILDEGEVILESGDVVVECGTHHAWSNQTESMCRIAFILIDAE